MPSHVARGKSVEASGRTIDEAVDRAIERLGRDREQVEVQVLREASRGVLGFGAHDAIVRVTELLEPVAEPSAPPLEAPPPAEESPSYDEEPSSYDEETDDEDEADDAELDFELDEDWEPEEQEAPRRREPAADPDELMTIGREVLLDLLERMSVIADVLASWSEPSGPDEERTLVLDIVGDDPGLLIGRRGETLRDLQYIVRLVVGRRIQGWANVIVDVEGYKQRRARTVRDTARRLADRVLETSRPVHMEPMNPYERRLVHIELREVDGVTTRSSGEGSHRRVGIFPA